MGRVGGGVDLLLVYFLINNILSKDEFNLGEGSQIQTHQLGACLR